MRAMNFNDCDRAYSNDPVFRQYVDMMYMAIEQMNLTPTELRAMANYACLLHERRRPFSKPIPVDDRFMPLQYLNLPEKESKANE